MERVYLTEELSKVVDFWQNDTSGQLQIAVNRVAKLLRQEAFLIPQMPTTSAGEILGQPSLVSRSTSRTDIG
jgi:hypothetical protein